MLMKANTQILDKKIELIQWLSSLEDKEIIEKLIQFRRKAAKDWWDSISDDEKASIEKGLKDAEGKKMKSHISAKQRYEKWL